MTQFFVRVRARVGLEHVDFHSLRKFMETYAQDLGFAPAAVAMRAGHDPSVMAKHYTGRIEKADRALASAVAALIAPAKGHVRTTGDHDCVLLGAVTTEFIGDFTQARKDRRAIEEWFRHDATGPVRRRTRCGP